MFQQFTAGKTLADKVAQQLVEMTDRLCREFAPDLIVTDYAMPGSTGCPPPRRCSGARATPLPRWMTSPTGSSATD